MPELIRQIVYRSKFNSSKRAEFSLEELLRKSRDNNKAKNITGMLLFHNDIFAQLIEGPEKEIQELYFEKIAQDDFHTHLDLLFNDYVKFRSFNSWSLGYLKIDEIEARMSSEAFDELAPIFDSIFKDKNHIISPEKGYKLFFETSNVMFASSN